MIWPKTGRWLGCALILLAGWCPAAQSAISLSHTRLIISASDREATPWVSNDGAHPVLLQVWMDTGEREADLRRIAVPFVVAPPLFRLEPGATKRLRILYNGNASVPQDRESVHWLNVLEIPPKADAEAEGGRSRLQLSFRIRVKVFYRPEGMEPPGENAHEKLVFELRRHGQEGVVRVTNPTAVHQTLLDVAIGTDRQHAVATSKRPDDMIAPHASIELPVKLNGPAALAEARAFYSVINDYGSVALGEQDIRSIAGPQ